jgi:hypothetical protein
MSPISNAFVRPDRAAAAEKFYPLRSFVCDCCQLVQLEDFETPDALFHSEYPYFSSVSGVWLDHARTFVDNAVERFAVHAHSHVVEIASNDGYLLQYFVQRGIPCLGVDPAANCAKAAWEERHVRTEVAFFGTSVAERLRAGGHDADLMIANNVLAHVPDINDFVAGFGILLKPHGTAVFEFPHILQLIRNTQFDTIYHEHYSYLSLIALEPLFARHRLQVVDVDRLPTHGGSLRLYVTHAGAGGQVSANVVRLKSEELASGLARPETYVVVGEHVRALKRALLSLLIPLKEQGKLIVGYGAPAKGNTLLNYCGIGTDFLPFVMDRSVHKQGLLLPGTRIPIRAPDAIFEVKPDYVLILPWNLLEEITDQLAGIREWGGRFIVPIPRPVILDAR